MAEKAEFEIFELYKGKIQVKFYTKSHQYWVSKDGGKTFKRAGGTTTIIGIKDKSKGLVPWATELGVDYLYSEYKRKGEITKNDVVMAYIQHEVHLEKASTLGTNIHDWAEQFIKYKLGIIKKMPEMPEDENVQIGANAFMDWVKVHKVKFLSTERVVYSIKHDFMGRMDIEAEIDGERCLVDLKTSNGLYNGVRMQTAAYVKADEEESGKKYDGRWAIRLSKETREEYIKRMTLKEEKKKAKKIAQGKPVVEEQIVIPDYCVFEARYLDEDKSFMDRDFKQGFLSAQGLFEWDKETDFWKEDNK